MSRSAPYDNPYASLPTTDAPAPSSSSSSPSSTPMTYPPTSTSQLQSSSSSGGAGASAAFAGAGTRPQYYGAAPSPPSTSQGHQHRPFGSFSSVATLKNEENQTESPKPWPGKLPHVADTTTSTSNTTAAAAAAAYDKTYDYPYAVYDPAHNKQQHLTHLETDTYSTKNTIQIAGLTMASPVPKESAFCLQPGSNTNGRFNPPERE
ncbi:hypothetical protein FRC19_009374 [Serendipita sp. 401]|nr:hypothetical protein FRC19_009374 [Serendipita sp. 401]